MNMYCPTCGKPKLQPLQQWQYAFNSAGEWPYCTCLPQSTTQPITTTTYVMNSLPMVMSPLSPQEEAEVRRIVREEIKAALDAAMGDGK